MTKGRQARGRNSDKTPGKKTKRLQAKRRNNEMTPGKKTKFICALWSPAGKGLTSWLSFVVSSVSLSLSHWYPGSGVVLDCIDS